MGGNVILMGVADRRPSTSDEILVTGFIPFESVIVTILTGLGIKNRKSVGKILFSIFRR